jgi:hypothetical protein
MWRIDSLSVGILVLGWKAKAKITVGCGLPAASTSSRSQKTDHDRWNGRSRPSGNHDHAALEWMITIIWNP